MPITQSRMLRLLAVADAYNNILEELSLRTNELYERTESLPEVGELKGALASFLLGLRTLQLPRDLYEAVVEERTHFKFYKHKNNKLRAYQRRKRAEQAGRGGTDGASRPTAREAKGFEQPDLQAEHSSYDLSTVLGLPEDYEKIVRQAERRPQSEPMGHSDRSVSISPDTIGTEPTVSFVPLDEDEIDLDTLTQSEQDEYFAKRREAAKKGERSERGEGK